MSNVKTRALPGLSVRGDAEWVEWIYRAAAGEQRTCSSLIERVLIEWARAHGLPDPPRRQGRGKIVARAESESGN